MVQSGVLHGSSESKRHHDLLPLSISPAVLLNGCGLRAGPASDCSGHGNMSHGQGRCSKAHDAFGGLRAAGLMRAETHHPALHALQHPQGTFWLLQHAIETLADGEHAFGFFAACMLSEASRPADAGGSVGVMQGLLAAMQKRVAKRQVSLDAAAAEAAAALAANVTTKNEKVRRFVARALMTL